MFIYSVVLLLICSGWITRSQLKLFFFLTLSDEVVTAAQHLYEMVSFYFDDLGKLLFYKSWLYHQGFPWGKFIGPSPFLNQQEFILVSRRIRRILAVLFERRQSFDVDYHLHCETEAGLHGAREMWSNVPTRSSILSWVFVILMSLFALFLFLPWLFVISMFLLTILILPSILVIAISVPIILLPLVAQSIYIPRTVKKNLVFVVRFSFDLSGLGLIGSGLSYLCLNLLRSELGH